MKRTIVALSLAFTVVLNASGPSAEELALVMARRYGAQEEAQVVLAVLNSIGDGPREIKINGYISARFFEFHMGCPRLEQAQFCRHTPQSSSSVTHTCGCFSRAKNNPRCFPDEEIASALRSAQNCRPMRLNERCRPWLRLGGIRFPAAGNHSPTLREARRVCPVRPVRPVYHSAVPHPLAIGTGTGNIFTLATFDFALPVPVGHRPAENSS